MKQQKIHSKQNEFIFCSECIPLIRDAIFNYLHTFFAHFTTVSTDSEKLFEIAQ